MTEKCFGCGRYLAINKGKATKVTQKGDPSGFAMYFCDPCVDERVAYMSEKLGRPATFEDYISSPDRPKVVERV